MISKQKCIDYIEKIISAWIQHCCLVNMVFAFDPSNSDIKRLYCTNGKFVFLHGCDRLRVMFCGNPFIPNGLFYLHSLDRSNSNIQGVWLAYYSYCHVL